MVAVRCKHVTRACGLKPNVINTRTHISRSVCTLVTCIIRDADTFFFCQIVIADLSNHLYGRRDHFTSTGFLDNYGSGWFPPTCSKIPSNLVCACLFGSEVACTRERRIATRIAC